MAWYLSKYLLSCITAPMLCAAFTYWRVSFSASAASSEEMNLWMRAETQTDICRRARAFRLSVRFRFAASSLEMLLAISRMQ